LHHSRLPVVAVAVVEVVVGAEIPPVATEVAAVVEGVVGAEIPPVVAEFAAAVVDIEIVHGAVVEIVVEAVDRQVVVGTRVAVHNFPSVAPLLEREDAYLSEHHSA